MRLFVWLILGTGDLFRLQPPSFRLADAITALEHELIKESHMMIQKCI